MPPHATRLADNADNASVMRLSDQMMRQPRGSGRAVAGFRPDGGGAVTVNAGMQVRVSPFMGWVDGAAYAEGGYTFISDPTGADALITIPDGSASGPTVHTICAVVENAAFSGSVTQARLAILSGTAGAGTPNSTIPARWLPIRDILVPTGRNSGNGGLVGGDIATDRRVYTAALGGVVPTTTAGQGGLTPYEGYATYNRTTGRLEIWNGTKWVPYGSDIGPTSYTPDRIAGTSASALAIGNGTMAAEYMVEGRWVTARIALMVGSSTALGSGPMSFSLPVGPVSTNLLVRSRQGHGQGTITPSGGGIGSTLTPMVLGLATGSPWNAVHQGRIVAVRQDNSILANTHIASGSTLYIEVRYMINPAGE